MFIFVVKKILDFMKKKFVTMMVMVMATALWAIANDSEYYSVGNQLVPV